MSSRASSPASRKIERADSNDPAPQSKLATQAIAQAVIEEVLVLIDD